MFADHVSDLSSSQKPIICLSFLFCQVYSSLEIRQCQDLLQSRCDVGVQCLEVGKIFHRSRVTSPQVVNTLSCLSFSYPRHCTRWVTRTRTNFCSEIQLPKAERCRRVNFHGIPIYFSLYEASYGVILGDSNVALPKVVAKSQLANFKTFSVQIVNLLIRDSFPPLAWDFSLPM